MEKLLFTCRAYEGKMALVLLHMIVHRILLLLDHVANGANEQSIRVLLVFHTHA